MQTQIWWQKPTESKVKVKLLVTLMQTEQSTDQIHRLMQTPPSAGVKPRIPNIQPEANDTAAESHRQPRINGGWPEVRIHASGGLNHTWRRYSGQEGHRSCSLLCLVACCQFSSARAPPYPSCQVLVQTTGDSPLRSSPAHMTQLITLLLLVPSAQTGFLSSFFTKRCAVAT